MMRVKHAIQWFPGVDHEGVFKMPNHTTTDHRRGIIFDRPEGFYADTVLGRQPITPGSWLVTCRSGNLYVVKEGDYWPDFGTDIWCNLRRMFK